MPTFGTDWTPDEAEAAVAVYFAMLQAELAGQKYVKADYIRDLALAIKRTPKSVEWKFQNVSAVLIAFGYPYISGYKPAWNYQALLETVVLEHIAGDSELWEVAQASPVIKADAPHVPSGDPLRYIEGPPDRSEVKSSVWVPRTQGTNLDFVRRDADNRELGRRGEEFVLELERRRLQDLEGRADLAKKVEWVSQTRGDGLGYDIRSFVASGDDRLIEVKTTGLGKYFPFVVTTNEVQCSQHFDRVYSLYRVFDFSREPKLYMLDGSLTQTCALEPTQYRGRPK